MTFCLASGEFDAAGRVPGFRDASECRQLYAIAVSLGLDYSLLVQRQAHSFSYSLCQIGVSIESAAETKHSRPSRLEYMIFCLMSCERTFDHGPSARTSTLKLLSIRSENLRCRSPSKPSSIPSNLNHYSTRIRQVTYIPSSTL